MNIKQIYFKSDFTVILASEAQWGGCPFRLSFYTASPSRSFVASFDGENYENCRLLEDGRLEIGINQKDGDIQTLMGIGTLRVAPEFYLDNDAFRDHICNEFVSPFIPKFVQTDGTEYQVALGLEGHGTLETIGTLPAFYMKGDKGDRGDSGKASIDTELDPETADNEHAAGALVTAMKFSELPIISSGTGENSFIVGQSGNTASDKYSSAFGHNCKANGYAAFASGNDTTAGDTAHSEGYNTKALGRMSHAEGESSESTGNYSHAEGFETKATSDACHAEGQKTTASGLHSHAEGDECVAMGNNAHAEGRMTKATGNKSHAEGYNTEARGENSHAEGENTLAEAKNSHAAGVGTIAAREGQYVVGRYNIRDTENYIFIVGNGTSSANRSNAFAIKDDGTVVYWIGGNEFTMGLDFVEALNRLINASK